ncbi:MAG TPA: primosomal protein N' [Planctomycetaceae bacterium]|nr:primosomal protein N' [Planctomycetaceae bacterium]
MPRPTQQSFFDEEPQLPAWEEDDRKLRRVARIVFPNGLDGTFDYLVPEALLETVAAGMRVMVPLGRGNRLTLGYCIAIQENTASYPSETDRHRLKSIASVVDEQPLLSESMIRLTRWIAWYYLCPLGQVLDCVLPAGVRGGAGTRLTSVLYVNEKADELLARLPRDSSGGPLTPKQRHVFETLRRSCEPLTSAELRKAAKCSAAPILLLKRLGLFLVKTLRRNTGPVLETSQSPQHRGHPLNPDQRRCLDAITGAIHSGRHETFLLHGVTGSGKTEVYIRAIDAAVRQGRQAIVLVPEISLTPQTVGRFKGRFGEVAVLHSHLTDAQRHREWIRIVSGKVQVVVGARSAVFAPLPRLGLIVIDEEHENSFKQDTAPRYHAREVAKKRAENDSIPLVLGSATPSLESRHAAQSGAFSMLSMPCRVRNLVLPLVEIVDLREEIRTRTTRGAIHRRLHAAIKEALDGQGQVILLLNRRGFSTQIQCQACGEVVQCPECNVSLTHHRTEEIALCHFCGHQIKAPDRCPGCGFAGIRYSGFGTQRLEQEINARFPNVSCLRMDTDTMHGPGAHERALAEFREGRVRILLGTQMIAKGLDFPNVTLVGVINADTALHLPDFRASERTFHLITQVAGRTGRGELGGRVIVQTFVPDHAAILAASRHDYNGFVREEMPLRKTLGYPPFSKMIRIVVRGTEEEKTADFAKRFAMRLGGVLKENGIVHRLLGPAPAPFSKLRGFYRFHIQLHAFDGETLRKLVRDTSDTIRAPENIQWILDVDPLDML